MDLGANAFYLGPKIRYVHILVMLLVSVILYMIG